ncbi:hypothetical protein A2U01_0025016 [Trifolium medium]|uniref:Uncharacterized protein n=1 Tax=Trifolium medium TaxID=97028 RepID=A0A392NWZ4_9FABA|nr:hypothetical protein [Trifolium medium]
MNDLQFQASTMEFMAVLAFQIRTPITSLSSPYRFIKQSSVAAIFAPGTGVLAPGKTN